jgi:hypothetical protein
VFERAAHRYRKKTELGRDMVNRRAVVCSPNIKTIPRGIVCCNWLVSQHLVC